MREAVVRLDGQEVGRLAELSGGGTRFTYTDAWVRARGAPVSLTLPTRSEPYDHPGIAPFFLNLLPEGWLLELSVSRFKLSRDDPFALLLTLCRDCVGAVEIWPPRTEETSELSLLSGAEQRNDEASTPEPQGTPR